MDTDPEAAITLKNIEDEAGSTLSIAWDNIPESKPPQQDAAQGMEMVLLGIAVVAIYRKRKIHKEGKQ
ncbi:MAG: hypothetical protein HXS44_06900 [Theionarchaea archaeon]|nr:hypothetical protein [Theionarchaea archaeon]